MSRPVPVRGAVLALACWALGCSGRAPASPRSVDVRGTTGTGWEAQPAAGGGKTEHGPAANALPVPAPDGVRIVGYYPAWATFDRNFQVADIRAERLTHVNYAFANVSEAGECVPGDKWADLQKPFDGDGWQAQAEHRAGNFNQLAKLKAAHPKLRTLISVGGWSWSARFSDVAATTASRERFAASCAAFVKDHGFDGLDVDWEYPVEGGLGENVHRPQDGENFVALLLALRSALDAASTPKARFLLTIAASAVPRTFEHLDLARVAAPLDWMNLMTYDFNGGWSPFVAHNAPLFPSPSDPSDNAVQRERFNAAAAVDAYLEAGVPAAKITLGVPFYGRGWGGVPAKKNGLFQTAKGPLPRGLWDAGVFDYGELVSQYVGHGDFVRSWDAAAKVPSLYSPALGVFISYDDPQSIAEKVRFIATRSLGGAMIWNLSSDDARGTLLSALRDAL